MTDPTALGRLPLQQEADSVDNLSRMLTGTTNLATNPGLVQAMVSGRSTPQQSQAIDQFMGGLNAEKKVALASRAGTKVPLSGDETKALDALGVNYQSVLYTQQDAVNDYATHLEQTNNVTLKRDAAGNPIVDGDGNLQLAGQPHKSKGWSFGRVIHDITHNPVTGVGGDVLNVLNKGWNVVDTNVSDFLTKAAHGFQSVGEGPDVASHGARPNQGTTAVQQGNSARDAEMQALGYDPNNPFSTLAFQASGKAHVDTTPIADSWDTVNPAMFGWDGTTAVTQAEAFTNDPAKWRQGILNDSTLTPQQAAAKLTQITDSKQFQALIAQVNGSRATIGNDLAHVVGLDPVKNPEAFKWTSLGLDVAASFVLDPTAIGLGAVSNVKRAQLGIQGIADSQGVMRVLDKTNSTGMFAKRAQGALDRMVGYGNQIREAETAGDATKAAQLTAQAATENPALATFLPDFVGRNQITGVRALTKGEHGLPFVYGEGEALDTYEKAADYLVSKTALVRAASGRAIVESTLMPGAVSAFGLRRLRGAVSSWQVGRDLARTGKAEDTFLAAKAADPAKFEKLLDEKDLARVLPHADDAHDLATGEALTVAAHDLEHPGEMTTATLPSQALPSQARAAATAEPSAESLTAAERGQVAFNMRRYGQATIPSTVAGKTLGWVSPTAVAARARLAVRRFTTWLPRDTEIDLMGSNGMDIVDKMAKTYLTKGDAAMLRAQYTLGDGGQRTAVVEGLMDQLGHAAGLTRTSAGRDALAQMKTESQRYSSVDGDEVVVNGQNLALHGGQARTTFRLPAFGQLQRQSAKIGLWEGTLGRALTSSVTDKFVTQWKFGAIGQPRTAFRAGIESWLNAAVKGQAMQSLRAKALATNMGLMSGQALGRTRFTTALARFGPVAKTGQFYRHVLGKGQDAKVADELLADLHEVLPDAMPRYANMHMQADIDPAGMRDAGELTSQGWQPARLSYDVSKDARWSGDKKIRTGFGMESADGVEGTDRYATSLAQRVNATPEVARAAVAGLAHPDDPAVLDNIISALEAPQARNLTEQTAFGSVFWRDGETEASTAVTDAEKAVGKQQWAQRILNDYRYLATGRNGQLQTKLTDFIAEHGKAPDTDWLMGNLTGDHRPTAVLAPRFEAVPQNGITGWISALQDLEGKGYQYLVERLINRTTTAPMFMAAYGEEKVALAGWRTQLEGAGLSKEAANQAARELAMQSAWNRIALMVDDPQLKSQMDVVGRNFFAFSRATTTMVRRWGTTFYQNPAAARRMMLALEGANHSGITYRDQNGNLMFSFPGSGALIDLFRNGGALAHIPGFDKMGMFPTSDLTGRVDQIIPGSSNPFQYSLSPMVTVPMSKIAAHFPDVHQVWDEVDRVLNGPNSGQGVLATLTPSLSRPFTQALSENDRNSMLASAMMGTVANLAAAGQIPPADASPADVDKFLGRVHDGTKSQLIVRAIFAPLLFTSPSNVEGARQGADFAYSATGAKSLSSEYKELVNDTGGDLSRANQIWLAMHPDAAAYTVPESSATTSKAQLPATQQALDWMQQNHGFLGKYKSVGAYFLPQPAGKEPFSMQAYQAQLELGLRQKKTPTEFYQDVRVRDAENVYYAMQDKKTADINSAKADGNKQLESTLGAQWTEWKKQFNALNPLFAAKMSDFATARQNATGQLKDLSQMVASGDVPSTVNGQALTNMLQAYGDYERFVQSHPGSDAVTTAMHSAAAARFTDYMSGVIRANPELQGLYSGVFRQLDSNLATASSILGGGK